MSSSIGTIGSRPTSDTSERLRGIIASIIDEERLGELSQEFDAYVAQINAPTSTESRLSLRVVCPERLVDRLPGREAMVPLTGDLVLAYLGYVRPERALTAPEREQIAALRHRAEGRFGPQGAPDLPAIAARFARARAKGYAIEVVVDPADRRRVLADDRPAVAALLDTFGYRDGAVGSVIADADNVVALARHDGTVVGIVVAERAEIPIARPGGPDAIRISELTDSCVHRAHIGHALQALLHVSLIERLIADDDSPNVIFSESTYRGSLANAAMLGRTFAGTLPNHVAIGSRIAHPHARPSYESLEVTYLTPDQARSLIAGLDDLRQLAR